MTKAFRWLTLALQLRSRPALRPSRAHHRGWTGNSQDAQLKGNAMKIGSVALLAAPGTVAMIVLSLAGLIVISAAAAGEGSSDIGRQPPYGYFANERGSSAPDARGGPATHGAPKPRAGRTVQPRSRR